jgi:hypothetical protein
MFMNKLKTMTILLLVVGVVAFPVVLAFIALSPAASPAEPATLGIDDIIGGVEANQKAWQSQTSWMVRYTHMRERIQPPPGKMVEFPDVELINARKGPALFIYFNQPRIATPDEKRESWRLWKDKHCIQREDRTAFMQDDPAPLLNYYWYPCGLFRDLFSDTIPIPEEGFDDGDLALFLPRCLKVNKGEYIVRKELEEIDGGPCHVLERKGKDIIWIDAKRGFNVCRRTVLQPSGNVLVEFKAIGLMEKVKGIWLPKRQLSVVFNFDADPREDRLKVRFVMANTLLGARFNDLPDSFFEVPLPNGVTLTDHRKLKDE